MREREHKRREGDEKGFKNLTELLLNDGIVCKSDSATIDLSVSALVDQLTDTLQVGNSGKEKQS